MLVYFWPELKFGVEGFALEELVLVNGRMSMILIPVQTIALSGVDSASQVLEFAVGDSCSTEWFFSQMGWLLQVSGDVFQTNATILMSVETAQIIASILQDLTRSL